MLNRVVKLKFFESVLQARKFYIIFFSVIFSHCLDGLAENSQSILATYEIFQLFRFVDNFVKFVLSDLMYVTQKTIPKYFTKK